jgi:hypothetical protein
MSFSDFHGNSEIVQRLREIISRDQLPDAEVLAGGERSCNEQAESLYRRDS